MTDERLHDLADEVVLALAPLVDAAGSQNQFVRLLTELGWTTTSVPAPLLNLATAGSSLLDVIASAPDDISTTQVLDALGALFDAIDDIRAAPDNNFPDSVDITAFRETIGRDLLDYCVVEYLLTHRYKVGRLLKVSGILGITDEPASGLRKAYRRRFVKWGEAGNLLTDPFSGLRDAYAWQTSAPRLSELMSDVAALVEAYDLLLSFSTLSPAQLVFANAGSTEPMAGAYAIRLDVGESLGLPPGGSAGFEIFPRAPTPQRGHSVAIAPFAELPALSGPRRDEEPSLRVSGTDLAEGFAVTLVPSGKPIVEAGFLGTAPPVAAELRAELRLPPKANQPEQVILGTTDGSHVSVHTVVVTAGAELQGSDSPEVFVEIDLERLRVVIRPSDDADAFLTNLLGPDGISSELSAGLRVSSETGFHLTGAAGLEGSFAVNRQIGALEVISISVALKPGPREVDLEVGATVAGELGPFTVVVDRVGFMVAARFPEPPSGNLGPLDVGFGFLAPSGLGLSVRALGILTGGGFIGFEPSTGRYSGQLQLQAGAVGVSGIGILDTRLSGGGYSLLLLLGATFPAIQVGMGFALTGAGGLVGLNRRVNVDALRGRIAAGTAGRILSPQDPVRNAPSLIADLESIFPPSPGVTVVGPTAQLIWAELVHLDIGVFIELPRAAQALVLGSAYADISSDGRSYLSIRVDVVGVVDLQAKTAAFDAALVDSHLLGILDLTGGAALRLSWGAQPYAVLALGGFHPAYNPEPLSFPASLTRIAMVHGTPTDEVYLRFEGYFAITSNTLQLGASVEAAINFGGWAIHGSLVFDALIQRVPYHFEIDIRATVSVAYRRHSLASLILTGSLSGPGPVVLRARVCIELLFFDICFSHTFELGPTTPPPVPMAPDLLEALVNELIDPARLHTSGPADPFVRLRPQDVSSPTLVAVPTGTIIWSQHRAPLELLVTRIGGTPLQSPVQVTATSPAPFGSVADWFAPGAFLDLTSDEALTAPSYELLASGLRLSGSGTIDGPSTQATPVMRQIRLPAGTSTTHHVAGLPPWLLATATRPASEAISVTTESWTVTAPSQEQPGLTGAQARRLAALAGDAHAIPTTDRVAEFSF